MTHRVLHLDDLDAIAVAGVNLHPLRRALGVTGFGVNAFSAQAGERLIEDHDEAGEGGSGGHEELYVVMRGRATFSVDGEELDVRAGGVVFLPEPATRRGAIATEDGTLALAVGNRPGAAGPVSAWEHYFVASGEADPAQAYAVAAEGLADHPDNASLHYSLACFASLAGEREQALDHLRRAFAANPATREWAADDADLDPIRNDPAFPSESDAGS